MRFREGFHKGFREGQGNSSPLHTLSSTSTSTFSTLLVALVFLLLVTPKTKLAAVYARGPQIGIGGKR